MSKVKYTKKTYKRHAWEKNSDGSVNTFAFSSGFCNGPFCTRCAHSFCEHCNPHGWDDTPCVVEKWECPKCHHKLMRYEHANFCPNCGEKLEWPKEAD